MQGFPGDRLAMKGFFLLFVSQPVTGRVHQGVLKLPEVFSTPQWPGQDG